MQYVAVVVFEILHTVTVTREIVQDSNNYDRYTLTHYKTFGGVALSACMRGRLNGLLRRKQKKKRAICNLIFHMDDKILVMLNEQ